MSVGGLPIPSDGGKISSASGRGLSHSVAQAVHYMPLERAIHISFDMNVAPTYCRTPWCLHHHTGLPCFIPEMPAKCQGIQLPPSPWPPAEHAGFVLNHTDLNVMKLRSLFGFLIEKIIIK